MRDDIVSLKPPSEKISCNIRDSAHRKDAKDAKVIIFIAGERPAMNRILMYSE
jgi:hypothetical protein